jgi:MFS family permease
VSSVPAAAAEPAAPARPFREVWLVTIGHALTHWYPATFYLLLPLIGAELGLSYSQIGLVMSCQYIAGAISNIPGGMYVDTSPRKGTLLAISLFWIGFPYLLIGFTHTYWLLLVSISLVGIGNNLWHPAAIPGLASRYPERKGLVLSVHGMGGNVGDALAPLAVGALLSFMSWREIVMVNLVPGVVVAILILAFLGTWNLAAPGDSAGKKGGQSWASYMAGVKALFKSRSTAVLLTSSAFRTLSQATLLTFLPVFLTRELEYSPFWVGACLFIMQAAGFAASPIAGHWSDKVGRRKIILGGLGLTAIILFAMALAPRSQFFIFMIAGVGFFLYATRPVLQAWMLDTTPKNMGGTSIGIMFGCQALGSAIGPVVGGMIGDQWGLLATFYFIAATIVVANFFIFLMPELPADRKAAA